MRSNRRGMDDSISDGWQRCAVSALRYMQHASKERIVLKDRKGFVRIAVEEGLDGGIVPVYHFGNTKVFDFVPQVRGVV